MYVIKDKLCEAYVKEIQMKMGKYRRQNIVQWTNEETKALRFFSENAAETAISMIWEMSAILEVVKLD